MAANVPSLPGLLVMSAEYPPRPEDQLATLDAARELVGLGYAVHVADFAARQPGDDPEINYEIFTQSPAEMGVRGIVLVNSQDRPTHVSHKAAFIAETPAAYGPSLPLFLSGEAPTGSSRAATKVLRRTGAVALDGNYEKIAEHLRGEQ
jgi:hypothetical protein